jgi:pimeloyl-ACP methyl ester carboxylesterase
VELELYDYGGSGRELLLLHGGADNVESWRELAPLLRNDFRLFAYDARGHGRSPTPEAASVEEMVEDVFAVADELELDRPVLVGHSMGGVNALLAAAREDRFAGVVALDAVPRWWSRPNLTDAEFAEIGRSRGAGWLGTAQELELQIAAAGEGKEHAELIRAVLRRNHEVDGNGLLRRKPHPEYALRLGQLYQGPDSGLTEERIAAARCPVRLLCSERWVHGDDVRKRLATLPAHIEVEWLATSHYVHWDAPDPVADRIRELA